MNNLLTQAVQTALDAHPAGLTEREIRRALIEQMGLRCTPHEVREALHTRPHLFVGLAGGVWRSRAAVEAEQIAVQAEEVHRERGKIERPYLADLPSLRAFIAFDQETTGVKVEQGRIVQIAAVRIVDGCPATASAGDGADLSPVFDEYVDLEGHEIPYGLKVKLGFVEHPEWEEKLARAAPPAVVLAGFRRWVGGLPLVAHNARFDLSYLKHAVQGIRWEIANPIVDSMELACLACHQASTGDLRNHHRDAK